MIPITVVECDSAIEELVLEVLRSNMLAQGPMVERFEAKCCEMTTAKHAIAVSNGTIALVAAIEALELVPGDEVVTTPFTFVGTLNAILESGAVARFADVDETDFNIDPATIEAVLTERTRALLPVHLYGQACALDETRRIATARGLNVIEDAAQAHGAVYRGERVGGGSGMSTFSFYATKNLFSGEGGVITTNDDTLADRLRLLRNHGMRARYQYELPGHNYRLTDLAAAVAIPQFDRLDAIIDARAANAAYFADHLGDIEGVVLPAELPERRHAWHQYTVRVTADAAVSRDELLQRLHDAGIGAGIYYPRAVYDYECYRVHPRVRIPDGGTRAERLATEVLSLPVHQHLTESQRDQIVAAMRRAVEAP